MSSQDISEYEKDVIESQSAVEKNSGNDVLSKHNSHPSLQPVPSNALSRIASRFSTRDIVDPGPPPDGGLKAWTQVAMGWVVCFCTWYVRNWNHGFSSAVAYSA